MLWAAQTIRRGLAGLRQAADPGRVGEGDRTRGAGAGAGGASPGGPRRGGGAGNVEAFFARLRDVGLMVRERRSELDGALTGYAVALAGQAMSGVCRCSTPAASLLLT